jgi:hypothetical protein
LLDHCLLTNPKVQASLEAYDTDNTMSKAPIHVLITGAAGQIGYALAPMVARGAMLGSDQPVVLHLLDIEPAAQALEGVKMELLDAAFPLLHGMYVFSKHRMCFLVLNRV